MCRSGIVAGWPAEGLWTDSPKQLYDTICVTTSRKRRLARERRREEEKKGLRIKSMDYLEFSVRRETNR